jgi:hypothetical protein
MSVVSSSRHRAAQDVFSAGDDRRGTVRNGSEGITLEIRPELGFSVDASLHKISRLLKGLNIYGEVRELPAPVPTAADAAAQLGCEINAIANSLVFTADGEPLLVLASGAHRVNVKRTPSGEIATTPLRPNAYPTRVLNPGCSVGSPPMNCTVFTPRPTIWSITPNQSAILILLWVPDGLDSA